MINVSLYKIKKKYKFNNYKTKTKISHNLNNLQKKLNQF